MDLTMSSESVVINDVMIAMKLPFTYQEDIAEVNTKFVNLFRVIITKQNLLSYRLFS